MQIDIDLFWEQPEAWPLDTATHIFLGRAVVRAATIVARDKWRPQLIAQRTEFGKTIVGTAIAMLSQAAARGELETASRGLLGFKPLQAYSWSTLDGREGKITACKSERKPARTRIHCPRFVPSVDLRGIRHIRNGCGANGWRERSSAVH
ncbi:hypothetical protein [Bosea sp. BIWAKO-01]|uniref:hypothetical protein n=1 Tax=Bosea sp. BIWAKO-01 TaxID=506668 RepID=UPI00159F11AB|nr:hypothetical protein [Bosea sp. BIWAKO-01]